MTKKGFNFISALVALVFAISIVFFAVSAVSENSKGKKQADILYEQLFQNTVLIFNNSKTESRISREFASSIKDFSNFQSLELKIDGKILFSYPPEKIRKISATAKQYSKTFTTDSSGQTVQLNAVIYTLKPNSIFYYAKVTFFFILIATVISILILIFVKSEEDHSKSVQEEISAEKMEIEESEVAETEPEDSNTETSVLFDDTFELEKDESSLEEYDESDTEQIIEEPLDKTESLTKNSSKYSISDISENFEELPEKQELLPGKDNFRINLEEELIHASGNETDLSVIIIRIQSLNKDEEILQQLIDDFNQASENKGKLYNYNSDSFGIILTDTPLDDGMKVTDSIYNIVNSTLTKNGLDCSITIGISSRTGRLISGERLITEAEQAQKHAEEDSTSPVIAFRVNPEKYRNFILNS